MISWSADQHSGIVAKLLAVKKPRGVNQKAAAICGFGRNLFS